MKKGKIKVRNVANLQSKLVRPTLNFTINCSIFLKYSQLSSSRHCYLRSIIKLNRTIKIKRALKEIFIFRKKKDESESNNSIYFLLIQSFSIYQENWGKWFHPFIQFIMYYFLLNWIHRNFFPFILENGSYRIYGIFFQYTRLALLMLQP